jgi:hypothetical protein
MYSRSAEEVGEIGAVDMSPESANGRNGEMAGTWFSV